MHPNFQPVHTVPRCIALALIACGAMLLCAAMLATEARAAVPESTEASIAWSAYCTAGTAKQLNAPEARAEALATLKRFGMKQIIIETNRGGDALTEAEMVSLRDYFEGHGIATVGGMATVPGGDWGVPANEGLAWFNYEHPKTQADLEAAVRAAARVFDRLVIDDFLLSGDTSAISEAARRGRDWGAYRRDLLTSLSQRTFIGPAREENPGIEVIVKFPQSYDRYHQFGYDVERKPQLYDTVWVGTETRGQYTQRFGFTQPYEGFVNFRWIESLSRGKMAAAWFDHGDCDGPDFVEQAWQTVLAGAREIVLFNFANLREGHPGHELLLADRPRLDALAKAVAQQPVTGVAAYKPANSDPASDMYIMDFVGMLGIPLVPVSAFPHSADTMFIPAYGAKDSAVVDRIERALAEGRNVVITAGLLAGVAEKERLAHLAGVKSLSAVAHRRTETVLLDGATVNVPRGLDLGGALEAEAADVVLTALDGGEPVPYLTTRAVGDGRLSVLNIHMFTQADFDAVNEVLLSPRNLGMLDMPQAWANTLRQTFGGGGEVLAVAPTRVTIQPLGETGWFIQNYNNEAATITLRGGTVPLGTLHDGFTGEVLLETGDELTKTLRPRSRLWVKR